MKNYSDTKFDLDKINRLKKNLAPHTGHGTLTGVVRHKMGQMRHETHIYYGVSLWGD